MTETQAAPTAGPCDACGTSKGPLLKLSLGRDFFGRVYDRLSPSSDQSPKWYCEPCSMQKNLQRDFRDIKTEYDKMHKGRPSELATGDQIQRAHMRLREIAAILGVQPHSKLIDPADVSALLSSLQARSGSPSPSH